MTTNPSEKHSVTIVSACMSRDGLPAFAVNDVEATQDEIDNGIHIYLVEADLLNAGFEEPFVHFVDGERPAFLLPAVREFLGFSPVEQASNVLVEES